MKETEILAKLFQLTDSLEDSETIINNKISELRKQGYFINGLTVSDGVAVLLVGRSGK
jgi:hypothetical protein